MSQIVAGMASSHAFALIDPADWDFRRERNIRGYERRYGVAPAIQPDVLEKSEGETLERRRTRYENVAEALTFLRRAAEDKKPDAIILVGDDQNENFTQKSLPQIAIYTGESIVATEVDRDGKRQIGPTYRSHPLAETLLCGLVEREFDVAFSREFADDKLLSHAHAPIMKRLVPNADIPFVLIFVNAIHTPAISPNRCYALGQAIRDIVHEQSSSERFAIYASGGLSHFTAGYPWPSYKGPHGYGSISEEFDRQALASMAAGDGRRLGELTSGDLLDNGDIEMRSWIVLLGAVGDVPSQLNVYEPFYSGLAGMGVAYWDVEGAEEKKLSGAVKKGS